MSKIVKIPTVTRMNLVRTLIYYKRIIRLQLFAQNSYTSAINHIGRVKRLKEARNNAFDKYRLSQLDQKIATLREDRKQTTEALTASGQTLINLIPLADDLLSFHDKCQLLNISHTAALKALNGDTTVSFERMIFSHALEYRGNEDCLPMDDSSMPFWNAIHRRFIHELKTNRELRQATTEVFTEMLPGVRQFQAQVMPDGTEVLKQLPPKLKVVTKAICSTQVT